VWEVCFDKLLSFAVSDLLPLYTEMPNSRSNAPHRGIKNAFFGEIGKNAGTGRRKNAAIRVAVVSGP